MTDRLTIALAQMNQQVGDLHANADAILAMRRQATGADLLLVPELQLVGYPPEDLVAEAGLSARDRSGRRAPWLPPPPSRARRLPSARSCCARAGPTMR
jgi:predicted amidohydrolase